MYDACMCTNLKRRKSKCFIEVCHDVIIVGLGRWEGVHIRCVGSCVAVLNVVHVYVCMHDACMASYHSAGGVVNVVFYVRHGEATVSAVIIAVVNTVLYRPDAQDSPHVGSEHHYHHYHHHHHHHLSFIVILCMD